jgi:hypothetical protein
MEDETKPVNEPDPGYDRGNAISDDSKLQVDPARKLEQVARTRRINLNVLLADSLTIKNNNDE